MLSVESSPLRPPNVQVISMITWFKHTALYVKPNSWQGFRMKTHPKQSLLYNFFLKNLSQISSGNPILSIYIGYSEQVLVLMLILCLPPPNVTR